MKKIISLLFISPMLLGLLVTGCSNTQRPKAETSSRLALGNLSLCQNYSGLPEAWLKSPTAGMVWIPEGEVSLGSDLAYPDEINLGQKIRKSGGYWMDQTEVSVAQFAAFVEATGYVSDAQKQKQAAVFSPDPKQPKNWWQLKSDYSWNTPNGADGPAPKPNEPARYITKNDAESYALWLKHDLPSEVEWEYAAKAGNHSDVPMHQAPTDQHQNPQANYWQGEFPFKNSQNDHFSGVAPVGCFGENAFHLYDMIANVWEWTTSPYQGAHQDQHMGDYQSLRKNRIKSIVFVMKGGSFLCADNYCARFRHSSRYPQEFDLAASHVGFRTIYRP